LHQIAFESEGLTRINKRNIINFVMKMNLALAQMDYPTVLNGRILIVKKFGGRF